MTQLLERAFQKVSSLPDDTQDAFASFILSEIESESRWNSLFENSQDLLSQMAASAIAEEKSGKASDLSLDRDFPKN